MVENWEVEQKYFVDDIAALRGGLSELGFSQVAEERHEDTYFRHPCRDFRESGEAFRLRMANDTACLTYKGPRAMRSGKADEVKTRPEIELSIVAADHPQWRSMLKLLGFTAVPSVRKLRQIFRSSSPTMHEITVALDSVEQLGEFAEIEMLVSREAELTKAQERIVQVGALLGLERVQQQSYLSQLLTKLGIE